MIPRILGTSRFLVVIAVIGSFLAAATLIIYGGLAVINTIIATMAQGPASTAGAKTLSIAFIEMIDVFLLGIVLYIIAAGLYELFVGHIAMPAWLHIHTLDELKSQLLMVIIVLLAVTFLGVAVREHGGLDVLYLGIATALVIAALGYLMRIKPHGAEPQSSLDKQPTNKGQE